MTAHAQPLRVVMLETMPVPVILEHEKYFLEGMKSLGYKSGETLIIDKLEAQGDAAKAKALLTDYLAKHRPDLVVSFATLASQAANEVLSGTNIPLVFCVVAGPVKAGLIQEVGHPTGTNVTGLVFTLLRQSKIDLAKTLLTQPYPNRPTKIGIINSSYPSATDDVEKLKTLAAKDKGISFVSYEVKYRPMPEGLKDMLTDVRRGMKKLSPHIDY